jgi:hypothetical protein
VARTALSRRQAYDNIAVGSAISTQERVISGSVAPAKFQTTFAHGENLIAVGSASLIENSGVGVDPLTGERPGGA